MTLGSAKLSPDKNKIWQFERSLLLIDDYIKDGHHERSESYVKYFWCMKLNMSWNSIITFSLPAR